MRVTDLKINDNVIVSEPAHDEIYNHSFEGTVCSLSANSDLVGVTDSEDVYFDVHIDKLSFDV
jgi:hypothetical protein